MAFWDFHSENGFRFCFLNYPCHLEKREMHTKISNCFGPRTECFYLTSLHLQTHKTWTGDFWITILHLNLKQELQGFFTLISKHKKQGQAIHQAKDYLALPYWPFLSREHGFEARQALLEPVLVTGFDTLQFDDILPGGDTKCFCLQKH